MAPTSVFFNGRLISIPGSYSEVDASGLETVGLSASGIVAVVGTAIGGKPYTAVGNDDVPTDLQSATNPSQPFKMFRSGDLREAAPILFGPSLDPDVPNGAQKVFFVKANPATQSEATFSNVDGSAMTLTSTDWGYHTRQIKVSQTNGSLKGKLVTIVFEGNTEALDNLGGDGQWKVKYLATDAAKGFTTATCTVTAAEIYTSFTLARLGLDSDITTQVDLGGGFELVSSSGSDTTQQVTVYGTNGTDAAQSEVLTVNGLTVVPSTKTWNKIHGAMISAAPVGTVTIRKPSAGATITTLTSGALTKALHIMSCVDVAQVVLTLVADGASTARVGIIGLNASGTAQHEAKQLNGSTPVTTTGSWSRVTYLAVGELAAARTVTASAKSVSCPVTGYNTLQKVADKFNATPGWTFTMMTGSTQLDPANMDVSSATDCKSPAEPTFYANLYYLIAGINSGSQYVTAERASPGTGVPTNFSNVYLAGGHEGSSSPGQEATPTATSADYQACLDLLKKVFVNSIGVCTCDPVVHVQLREHCAWMCGAGKMERDGAVGIQNATLDGLADKTEVKDQIVDLNTRHLRVWAQNFRRYNTAGVAEDFAPWMGALAVLGMQAGAGVGTPLTHKYINTLKLSQDSSWNPVDDAEEMIQAALCFGETIDGVGRRVKRNVTSHLSTSNLAYTEASVNQAVNYSVYNYRLQMETAVGKKGFAGTVTAAQTVAKGVLNSLIGVSLVTYRSLMMSLTLDVLESQVEIAPVLPVNFVLSIIHLVAVPQSAAA
jgi:hypothetical protein